ncbi:hypothetical protein FA13DRAFT_1730435, partial [Coprinellus micaceus]
CPKRPVAYEAWIEVEGQRIQEFQVERSEDSPRVTCWVPCEVGKEFAIGVLVPSARARETNHAFKIHIDGSKIGLSRNTMSNTCKYRSKPATRLFSGAVLPDRSTLRPFQFGDLDLTDDEAYLAVASEKYGQLAIEVRSADGFESSKPRKRPRKVPSVMKEEHHRIHERVKKGLTHCVKFGAEQPYNGKHSLKLVGAKTECTFVFHYRQIGYLVAQGIAPQSAMVVSKTGGRLKGKRKVEEVEECLDISDNSTDDEIQVLKARLPSLRELENKAEGSGRSPRQSKRVKKEPQGTQLASSEVIDLTALPVAGRVKREPSRVLVQGEVIDLTL